MDDYISLIKPYLKLKMVFLLVPAAMFTLYQLFYWSFEAAYFGYFGISPELFRRPAMSSDFVNVWLFVVSLTPAFFAWSFVMLVVFVLSVMRNYREINKINSCDIEGKPEIQRGASKIKYAIACSWKFPIGIWSSVFFTFLAILSAFNGAATEGMGLAKKQIDGYRQYNYDCFDGFDNNNLGCFSIEGVDGGDHLIISNNDTHLVYFSREPMSSDNNVAEIQHVNIVLHVVEKAPGEVFKILRQYKPK